MAGMIRAGRKKVSAKTRFAVFERDGFACRYCGVASPDVVLHVDHIVSVAEGGSNEPGNLVTSCESCNMGKGAMSLDGGDNMHEVRKRMREAREKREAAVVQREAREKNRAEMQERKKYVEATDAVFAGNLTLADIGRAMGVSRSAAKQPRNPPDSAGYRSPPQGWRIDLARLLRDRAEHDSRLAEQLERNANEP